MLLILSETISKKPSVEGHPKCIQKESAAIKHLQTSEGVVSNFPSEHGQLPKGVQQEFITKLTDDDAATTTAAVAIAEIDALYEEAWLRVDWLEWRRAIDVKLQNLRLAETWDVVKRPSSVNVVDSKWVFQLKKNSEGKTIK